MEKLLVLGLSFLEVTGAERFVMFTQAQEVIDFIAQEEIAYIDVRFCDLPGVQQHFTIPASELEASVLKDGLMFDGSSVRGFTQIHESDMKLIPDLSSAFIDPFRANKTLVIIFSIVDPFTDEPFSRDPRQVAAKAEAYLRSTGIADTCYIGAEAEFFVFNDVRYQVTPQHTFYALDSDEAYWNTGRSEAGGNLGYKVPLKGGYFPVSPADDFTDLRDEMANLLTEVGLTLERAHHEVGSGGQQEINYRFNTLMAAADDMMKFKYVIKNAARAAGLSATFMPKPFINRPGSGMHTHLSLFEGDENAFYDPSGRYQLSEIGRYFIAGLLHHAREIAAITNQHVNSYKRLWGGGEAPSYICWGHNNRSALVRVPVYKPSKRSSARIEYRGLDPAANPYLALAVLISAGLDGIEKKMPLAEEAEDNVWQLSETERQILGIHPLPSSLSDALRAMRSSDLVAEALGEQVFEHLLREKENEWREYRRQITPAELRQFLKVNG